MEDVEHREVVTIKVREAVFGLVGVPLRLLGPDEDHGHAEHRRDGQDLIGALVLGAVDEHFGQLRIQGELGRLVAIVRKIPVIIEATEVIEHLECAHQGLGRRGVQEVKVHEVVDSQLLQRQDHDAEVGSQDLRVCLLGQLCLEGLLRVEPEALPGLRAPGSARPLRGGGLRHRRDEQGLDADPGVVDLLLGKAWIHHVHNAVNGDRRLGDVCRDDDLPPRRTPWISRTGSGLEDLLLLRRSQRGIQGHHEQLAAVRVPNRLLAEAPACALDLLLAGEEEQHVPLGLGVVNLHHCPDGCLKVIPLWLRGVENLDRVRAAGDVQQRGVVKVQLHLLRVHRRRHDHHLHVRPPLHDLLEEPEENVCGQGPFVRLVEDDDAVSGEERVRHGLAQQHTIGQELENGLIGGLVLEADEVSDVGGQLHVELVGDTLGHAHGRHSSRLRTGNSLEVATRHVVACL
mmetsp:Transcript_79232/g.210411  ORF Transcript_79232/g.210411 Transcript_79232/m.210411 type:complete len:458 (+) Transcript_79232:652-2025(+)